MWIALILPFSDFQRIAYLRWFKRFFEECLVFVRLFHLLFFFSLVGILNYWFLKYCFSYLKIRHDYLISTAKRLSFAYCEKHIRIIARICSFKVSNKQLYLCLMPTEITAATKNPQSCNSVLFPTKALAFPLKQKYFILLPFAVINVSYISEIELSLQNIPLSKWRHCKKRIR